MEVCVCYVTCASKEEALRIAHTLLDRRLVACANILDGMTSVYRWEGEIHTDPEVLLLLKTRRDLVPGVIRTVVELHSYACPCVTVLPIVDGHRDYLAWIGEETEGAHI